MTTEDKYRDNLASIASELFRFEKVFKKIIGKLDMEDQIKYYNQYMWFEKKVNKAIEASDLHLVNVENMDYDPGMAVTPLNIDDFDPDDELYVEQMIEPIVMSGDSVYKTGTVILGKSEERE